MPKRSYGDAARRKTLLFLRQLLKVANSEIAISADTNMEYRWRDDNGQRPKLVVQASLANLLAICQKDTTSIKMNTSAVRNALYALEHFLEILEDNRINTQGATIWHFTLELWSRDTERNVILTDQLWQKKRKSNQLASELSLQLPPTNPDDATDRPEKAVQSLIEYPQLRDYFRRYRTTYGQIKILPGLMMQPVSIDSIYVDVKILDEQSKKLLSPTAIEEFYKKFNSRSLFGATLPRREGLEVARETQYLMVLGAPGIGKTTYLKKIGLDAINHTLEGGDVEIPVFIQLKNFLGTYTDFQQHIYEEIFGDSIDAQVWQSLEESLQKGELLILLDGLDEVDEKQLPHVAEQIRAFVRQFHHNHFIITCRTASHLFGFSQFLDVIIAEFNDRQIDDFIDKWFAANPQLEDGYGSALKLALRRSDNIAIRELARIPLLLIYLCLIYEMNGALPHNRHQLYEHIIQLFLRGWEVEKNISSAFQSNFQSFTIPLKNKILSRAAYETFVQNQLFFTQHFLLQQAINLIDQRQVSEIQAKPSSVLVELGVGKGIFVERFEGYLSFSHLTLHEYLTARYVVNEGLVESELLNYSGDRRWREVILLSAELLQVQSSRLLLAVQKQAISQIKQHPKLVSVLRWLGQFAAFEDDGENTIKSKSSVIASYAAIAASRASDYDYENELGQSIAHILAQACQDMVALAEQGSALHQMAIMCSVAIATAMAISADEVRAKSIDAVIQGAKDLIEDVSNDEDIVDRPNRTSVVSAASQFALQIAHRLESCDPKFADIYQKLSHGLGTLVAAIPLEDAEKTEWRNWAKQLERIWLEALGISEAWIALSLPESKALEQYLYLQELLKKCIDQSIFLSPPNLEQISTINLLAIQ